MKLTQTLPLVSREMVQAGNRRRTYAIRVAALAVFAFIFSTAYVSISSSWRYRQSPIAMLGQGSELMAVLLATALGTIYVFVPAFCSSAVSQEREAQTLPLLLLTRLGPLTIVLEKLLSRLIPVLCLILLMAPMTGICYLFGGITTEQLVCSMIFIGLAAVQTATVAIFCSSVLASSTAAFFCTYVILGFIYFTLPILHEMHLFPRLGLTGYPDEEFLLFPVYLFAMTFDRGADLRLMVAGLIPGLMISAAFVIAAAIFLKLTAQGAALSFSSLARRVYSGCSSVVSEIRGALRELLGRSPAPADPLHPPEVADTRFPSDNPEDPGVSAAAPIRRAAASAPVISVGLPKDYPTEKPIAWRERRGSWLTRIGVIAAITLAVLFFESFILAVVSRGDRDEFSVLFHMGSWLIATMAVAAVSTGLFASERQRQTLDSILTMPLSTTEIVRQKTAAANRACLLWVIPVLVTAWISLMCLDLRITAVPNAPIPPGQWGAATTQDHASVRMYNSRPQVSLNTERKTVDSLLEWPGTVAAFRYMLASAVCTWITLQISKWISVYFGLRCATQMKALMAALAALAVLCLVPMLATAMCMIAVNANPENHFPVFFLTSPAIVPVLNAVHELSSFYERNSMPDSNYLPLFLYVFIYGGLVLVLRTVVSRSAPKWLDRPE